MPIQPTSSMMAIATDSSKSVSERIKLIKGDDKRISSVEEANAILKIPSNDITWTQNKEELIFAQRDARHFLQYGDKNLRSDFVSLYNYFVKKGNEYLIKVTDFFTPEKTRIINTNVLNSN